MITNQFKKMVSKTVNNYYTIYIINFKILCKGFPSEFATYLTYTRSLKFEEKPEYSYCKYKNIIKENYLKI